MTKFNPKNERIKRTYVRFLKEADGKAEATIREIEKSLLRYETCTGFADFGSFNAVGHRALRRTSAPSAGRIGRAAEPVDDPFDAQ